MSHVSEPPLTHDEAVRIATAYVGAYNDRDVEAMLAVLDADFVSHPARLPGARPHRGHDGVRAWWQGLAEHGQWYRVEIEQVRLLGADRAAVLGAIHDGDARLSPWCVVIRIRQRLIVESRSYLSERVLLEDLGVLE